MLHESVPLIKPGFPMAENHPGAMLIRRAAVPLLRLFSILEEVRLTARPPGQSRSFRAACLSRSIGDRARGQLGVADWRGVACLVALARSAVAFMVKPGLGSRI